MLVTYVAMPQNPYESRSDMDWHGKAKICYTCFNTFGADSGFDGIRETQGACRGAVGLVKSRKKIVANDENYALAA
jgi:hypothetical protein